MEFVIVAAIVFFGIVTQSTIGFGVALITMPLLVRVLTPVEAAAFVALFTLPLQILIVRRYRHALNILPFWRVLVGSLIGIPVGIFLLSTMDQQVVLTTLGLFLVAYALYSLLNLRLPHLQRPVWGFGFGFASGVLGGAYNTGGPPLVIYGTALKWEPEQFKANMQVMFMVSNTLVILVHLAAGHIDAVVIENLILALPFVVIGTAVGFWLSKRINEVLFRKVVLVALLVIGIRLLLP